MPDDEQIPTVDLDENSWLVWDYLMRLYPGLLTMPYALCNKRLELFKDGKEKDLNIHLESEKGRWEQFNGIFVHHPLLPD